MELIVSRRYPSRNWSLSARSIRGTLVEYAPDAAFHALGEAWKDKTAKALVERVRTHYETLRATVEVVRAYGPYSPHGYIIRVHERF